MVHNVTRVQWVHIACMAVPNHVQLAHTRRQQVLRLLPRVLPVLLANTAMVLTVLHVMLARMLLQYPLHRA